MIDEAMAENYYKWGEYFRAQADYGSAIEKLEEVVISYPQSAIFADAYQSAAQSHFDLAMIFNEEEKYYETYNEFRLIENDYADYESMQQVSAEMPELLINYALVLRKEKSFLNINQQA